MRPEGVRTLRFADSDLFAGINTPLLCRDRWVANRVDEQSSRVRIRSTKHSGNQKFDFRQKLREAGSSCWTDADTVRRY